MPAESRAPRTSRFPVVPAAILGVLALAFVVPIIVMAIAWAPPTPPTTRVTNSDGTTHTVEWDEYPGLANRNADDILAAPSTTECKQLGQTLLSGISAAAKSELGLNWVLEESAGPNVVQNYLARNGYGGDSLLHDLTGPQLLSSTPPTTWLEKRRLLALLEKSTASAGYSDIQFEQDRFGYSDTERLSRYGSLDVKTQTQIAGYIDGPDGQWIRFEIWDNSQQHASEMDSNYLGGIPSNQLSLTWGCSGTLQESDRSTFIDLLTPYEGLAKPAPIPED